MGKRKTPIGVGRTRNGGTLNARTTLQIEIPEFLARAMEFRVTEANAGLPDDEQVELNDVVEWYLAAPITIRDVPTLEAEIPGFADALAAWLSTVTFEISDTGA